MITFLFTTVKNKIVIPREVKYVYLKVNIENEKYYYFYSFNKEDWHKIDIALESKKLSDDYIRGGDSLQELL